MADQNSVIISGNLTADPELKWSDQGKARATCSVAINRGKDDDKQTTFVDVTAFGKLGENIAASLKKGDRVVVSGSLNSYTTEVVVQDGSTKRIGRLGVVAWSIGPDLSWATAQVTKNPRQDSGNAGGGGQGYTQAAPPQGYAPPAQQAPQGQPGYAQAPQGQPAYAQAPQGQPAYAQAPQGQAPQGQPAYGGGFAGGGGQPDF